MPYFRRMSDDNSLDCSFGSPLCGIPLGPGPAMNVVSAKESLPEPPPRNPNVALDSYNSRMRTETTIGIVFVVCVTVVAIVLYVTLNKDVKKTIRTWITRTKTWAQRKNGKGLKEAASRQARPPHPPRNSESGMRMARDSGVAVTRPKPCALQGESRDNTLVEKSNSTVSMLPPILPGT
ncbi:hypothetical protein PHLCEN_2v11724 [Hermanssonia centrifuga]|uniref:Uncharacterized protein n=1 Tax=Hermanssonia centrifuga TaxID=98765 RepID=A0A2R6NJ97_9APHY|nr:hypothetical protein PHLCEN_2v11724 [Hermanssonia centrifuga]